MEYFKTGGGVPDTQNLTAVEEVVSEMMGSSVDGQPSIWDSDNMSGLTNIDTFEDDNINDFDNEDQNIRDDLTLFDEFENVEYLEDDVNQEETCKTSKTNLNKDIPMKGVRLLKRPTAAEVRPIKKQKKSPETAQQGNCEADRTELHKMRMDVLRKEFEINEARLQAAHLDIEIKQLQKKTEMARLRNLLE